MSIAQLRSRYRYSYILLKEIVRTDFKLRYQGSILGYLWSLLKPLAIFLIMYVVFLKFLKFNYGVPHTAVYLFVGIIWWSFFSEVTGGSVGAIVGKGDLLRKINFPKYVIVLAVSFSAVINLLLNFVVLAVFMFLNHVPLTTRMLLVIPLLIELYAIALAIAFILSTLFVRLRDLNHIWDVLMQALFYAVPLFYPIAKVPAKYAKWQLLNPPAQIIQDARYVVVSTQTRTLSNYWPHDPYIRFIPIGFIVILGIFAVQFFRKRSRSFAEEV
jgi:ABC-2 type transport system permease protein